MLVHDAVGPAMRRLLPRDMNPKIRAQLDAALGAEAGESGRLWAPGVREGAQGPVCGQQMAYHKTCKLCST